MTAKSFEDFSAWPSSDIEVDVDVDFVRRLVLQEGFEPEEALFGLVEYPVVHFVSSRAAEALAKIGLVGAHF